MPTVRDPRWVLLTETGQYSTIGRHSEPGEADIAAAETALARVGLSGWVAVMSNSVHGSTAPALMMVRPLRDPRTPFADAVHAFRSRVS